MITLATSQDVFYLVLSLCIVLVTVFLCVALFHLSRALKEVSLVTRDVRERIEKVTNFFTIMRDKIISFGLKGLMAMISSFRGREKNDSKKKK